MKGDVLSLAHGSCYWCCGKIVGSAVDVMYANRRITYWWD
jgi:hypothetical protein